MNEESSDIEMYSETESSDELVEALNNEIEQLEEKVKYYKTKANERINSILKLHFEMNNLKKQNDNLKSLLISKLPSYLNAIIESLQIF